VNRLTFASPSTESASKQAHSIRLLAYIDGHGWIQIGFMRGTAVPRKTLYLPEYAGKTIRVAIAKVRTINRKPAALNHLRIEDWKIDEDGNANSDDQLHHVVARMIASGKTAVAEMPC